MIIELKKLFIEQEMLDKEILLKHNLNYEDTYKKRILAFTVELSELANATRCFKFWSNKESEEKARIIDEFADGLHFILSIGIQKKYIIDDFSFDEEYIDSTEAFLKTYHQLTMFDYDPSLKNYLLLLTNFFKVALALNLTKDDVIDGYFKKLKVNHQRQDNNY